MTRMSATPDDPNYRQYYFDLARIRAASKVVSYFSKLDHDLITSQDNRCPVCGEDLFNGESLHRHHIIFKKDGGKFTFSNLVMTHSPCHFKIHSDKSQDWKDILISYKKQHFRLH